MGKVLRQGALAALAIALLIGIFGAPATALAKKFSPVGAVYVMSNNTTNTVMVFKRNSKGALKPSGSVKTGGMGSGSGLGSQGALAFSGDGKYLLAVNAGSADISVFMIGRYGDLKKVNEVSSEGTMPVSITSRGQWVYVLDRGGSGNIAGFSINKHGHLTFLAGSMQHLSNLGVGASPVAQQISFKPRSNLIVVTELSTNMIDVYALAAGGVAGAPTVQLSIGTAPYGFGFTHSGTLIVSNAASATLSSYKVSASTLSVVSSAVPDFQLAPCWVVVSPDGTHAYTADAHSNDISIYNVKSNGKISLEKSAAVKPSTPLDLAMTGNGKFLYALATGAHRVAAYGVKKHGLLKGLGSVGLLPASATGLVVW
ncbi:MAG: beta-propeller fold lactonase family protein [Coriobacteriia bacterium]|nr:beta-propeller fold lactonase family protein [Coriobacteriia bacterium]